MTDFVLVIATAGWRCENGYSDKGVLGVADNGVAIGSF